MGRRRRGQEGFMKGEPLFLGPFAGIIRTNWNFIS